MHKKSLIVLLMCVESVTAAPPTCTIRHHFIMPGVVITVFLRPADAWLLLVAVASCYL